MMIVGALITKQFHLKCLSGMNITLENGMMTPRSDLFASNIQHNKSGRALIIREETFSLKIGRITLI